MPGDEREMGEGLHVLDECWAPRPAGPAEPRRLTGGKSDAAFHPVGNGAGLPGDETGRCVQHPDRHAVIPRAPALIRSAGDDVPHGVVHDDNDLACANQSGRVDGPVEDQVRGTSQQGLVLGARGLPFRPVGDNERAAPGRGQGTHLHRGREPCAAPPAQSRALDLAYQRLPPSVIACAGRESAVAGKMLGQRGRAAGEAFRKQPWQAGRT